jgi:cell division initiation protein
MPVDLEHLKLRKSFRGYVRADVDELVNKVTATLDELLSENADLKKAIDSQMAELEMLRRDTKFVQEALITAQKTADEIRIAAQKHADLVVEEGRQTAQAEQNAAHQKVAELNWEMERLRQDRQRFVEDFRMLLDRHLRDLAVSPPLEVMEGNAS